VATNWVNLPIQQLDLDARRRAFADGLFFRAVAVAFLGIVLLATAIPSGLPLVDFLPTAGLVLFGVLINAVYWQVGKARGFPLGDFYVHWLTDLVTITAFLNWLGGLEVPYGPFIYSMIVITSATFMSRSGSYIIAAGASVCMVALAVGARLDILPHALPVWSHHYSPATVIGVVVGAVIFFFMNAYLAGTLSDQLKVANAQIEDQNRFLEQRVRERTLELQERTDELQELVHIVTHDLQNVAVASTETIRKLVDLDGPNLSPRGQRYADRLSRDCRTMTTMLRNLLEVVSQTEVADRREVVDVSAVVREAVARAQAAVESKGIEIHVGDLPPVHAELQKILHVFENLVSNACKYVGDKPHPSIDIGSTTQNGSLEYFVRDNGVGIEPTQLQRIFQLYHRAPDQTVAGVVQQGHGIGLAVVKRIVQRYGGRIWVESTPGEGAVFHISFPREERTET
jgi:signal transduction histidine kinase